MHNLTHIFHFVSNEIEHLANTCRLRIAVKAHNTLSCTRVQNMQYVFRVFIRLRRLFVLSLFRKTVLFRKPNTAVGYDSDPPRVTMVGIYGAKLGIPISTRRRKTLKIKPYCSMSNVSMTI